jgi:anti-anti-sigma factor
MVCSSCVALDLGRASDIKRMRYVPTAGSNLSNGDKPDVAGVFGVRSTDVNGDHVVHLEGELDLASRQLAYDACVAHKNPSVVVDLSGLTFIDCAGYGRLVTARDTLQLRGGELRLDGAIGQPARFLALVETHQPIL